MSVELNKRNVEAAIKKRFKNLVRGLSGKEVRIGIQASKKDSEGRVIAERAFTNEFGSFSQGIPSRPFARTTFNKDGQEKIAKRSFKAIQEAVLQEHGIDDALDRIGKQGAIMMRENIRNGSWTPNAPSTLAQKKGSRPLIDTSEMIQAIDSWIVKNDK